MSTEYAKCVQCLKDVGIIPADADANKSIYLSNYKKWAVKHHPDKGGDGNIFATISHCVDIVIKQHKCKNEELKGDDLKEYAKWVMTQNILRHRDYGHRFSIGPEMLRTHMNLLVIDTYVHVSTLPHPVLPEQLCGYIKEIGPDYLIVSDCLQMINIPLDQLIIVELAYLNKQMGQYYEKLFKCPLNKVYNPKSGRYVNRNGKLGKEILKSSTVLIL